MTPLMPPPHGAARAPSPSRTDFNREATWRFRRESRVASRVASRARGRARLGRIDRPAGSTRPTRPRPPDRPTDRPPDRPTDRPVGRPVGRSVGQISWPAGRSVGRISWPVGRSINRSLSLDRGPSRSVGREEETSAREIRSPPRASCGGAGVRATPRLGFASCFYACVCVCACVCVSCHPR